VRNVYSINDEFEKSLCTYTGAKYAVVLDNCSNALFLALKYEGVEGMNIAIPKKTYPSVPCEIIHAGGKVEFTSKEWNGFYYLQPTKVVDSSLRFTRGMYITNTHMCLSFTGPYKHLKLGKGGAILTDDYQAYLWFRRARFSGRRECSYHTDNFDMLGWNCYMSSEVAARGLLLMEQFYDMEGVPIDNENISLSYPDLSKFEVYGGVQ